MAHRRLAITLRGDRESPKARKRFTPAPSAGKVPCRRAAGRLGPTRRFGWPLTTCSRSTSSRSGVRNFAACGRPGARSPQRLTQILRERRKHDVEADADSLFFARAWIDGVLQVGRKYQHRSVLHSHDDLVGIFSCEFDDRQPDDPALITRVMEVDNIRPRMGSDVVHAAQEVVRMMVQL